MPSLDVIFAWIIAVLAGLACIGALVVVLVAEWYTIRRTIDQHRRPRVDGPPVPRWGQEVPVRLVPERRP
jgi:hypothetical protein